MMQAKQISLALCAALLVAAAGCGSKPANTGTTGTTATTVKVTDVTLGRALGADKKINDSTESFRPNDTIYASVATEGSSSSATLRAQWTFEDGQTVDQSTQSLAPDGPKRTEFHIAKPNGWPAGKYKLEVFLNDQPAGTKSFDVKAS